MLPVHLIVRYALRLRPHRVVVVASSLLLALLMHSANAGSVATDVTDEYDTVPDEVTYQSALAKLDNSVQAQLQNVERNPESWLNRERLANAYLERARLTGQFQHYAQADAAMREAAIVTTSSRNIALSRASLNYTLHRLEDVEADLQQAEKILLVNTPTQQRIDALRADVSLQQGRYSDALIAFEALDKQAPSTQSAFRLANYYWQLGEESSFEQWMKTASNRVMGKAPRMRAWLSLQLGIADLSRGRYDDALAHYNDALELFAGYWLIEEHIAEIDVIQGRLLLAENKYRNLIRRTDSPMFRIALAEVLQLMSVDGVSDEAMRLTQTARNQLDKMVNLIPESMAGHALEVSLHVDEPEKALALAEHNQQIRPNGEASVLLAQAYTLVGKTNKAQELLRSVLASPYRSPDLYATASVVSRINGEQQHARQFSKTALALKHDAMDDVEWLLH